METTAYLPFPNRNRKIEKIMYSDILYLEGTLNYTLIHLQNGKIKVSCRTLLFHIQNGLDASFIRIHRAFCVNKTYIQSYNQKEHPEFLTLDGGKKLLVSRRRMKFLRELN